MRMTLTVLAALLAGSATAQTEDHTKAAEIIAPMLQELAPGKGGEVLTACVVANSTPEELATILAAGAPGPEAAAVVNAVVARPETLACLQAAAQQ